MVAGGVNNNINNSPLKASGNNISGLLKVINSSNPYVKAITLAIIIIKVAVIINIRIIVIG